jgi:hypothetical protein
MQHLRRRQPPVDRHHHRVGLGHAEQQLEKEIAALVEMSDTRLRLDALGDQSVGHPTRGAIERSVGCGAAVIDYCGSVRPLGGVDAHDVCEARNLDRHPVFPWSCLRVISTA